MKNILIGVVLGALLVVGLLNVGTRLTAQQNRLQIHGAVQSGFMYFAAVCDSGSGTMIYGVDTGARSTVQMRLREGGCAKK